jgi:hypothetical protein
MTARRTIALTAALGSVTISGCASADDDPTTATAASSTPSPTSMTSPPATTTPTSRETAVRATVPPTATVTSATTATGPAADADVVVIRFTSGATTIDVTVINDNATTRDLLSMLPLTLRFEEFNGREKVCYLPRPLDTTNAPGADPEDGDLIYYAPWGNLGFYYNAAGIGFDDDVTHIGTYHATPDQLTLLEGSDVSVDVVE